MTLVAALGLLPGFTLADEPVRLVPTGSACCDISLVSLLL